MQRGSAMARRFMDEPTAQEAYDTYLRVNWGKPPVLKKWEHLKGKKPTFNQWKVSDVGIKWSLAHAGDARPTPVPLPAPSESTSAQLNNKKDRAKKKAKYAPIRDPQFAVKTENRMKEPTNGMHFLLSKTAQSLGLTWFCMPIFRGPCADYIGTLKAALEAKDTVFARSLMETGAPPPYERGLQAETPEPVSEKSADTLERLYDALGKEDVQALLEAVGMDELLSMSEVLLA